MVYAGSDSFLECADLSALCVQELKAAKYSGAESGDKSPHSKNKPRDLYAAL
jgi:hypothetical protein